MFNILDCCSVCTIRSADRGTKRRGRSRSRSRSRSGSRSHRSYSGSKRSRYWMTSYVGWRAMDKPTLNTTPCSSRSLTLNCFAISWNYYYYVKLTYEQEIWRPFIFRIRVKQICYTIFAFEPYKIPHFMVCIYVLMLLMLFGGILFLKVSLQKSLIQCVVGRYLHSLL